MPASLVRSQLDILELPNEQECAVVIETDGLGVDDILTRIVDKLKHMNIIF
jgi:gluconate kinase